MGSILILWIVSGRLQATTKDLTPLWICRASGEKRFSAGFPPDAGLIGVSCLFGIYQSPVIELVKNLKRVFSVPVVVGGDHASLFAREFIDAGADFVLRGEGEMALLKVLGALGDVQRLKLIPGLVGKDFDNGAPEFIENLDQLSPPAFDLLNLQSYWDFQDSHGPFIGPYFDLITSRGCPYDCNFCSAPALYRRRWRALSAKKVVDEISDLKNRFGAKDFHIQDGCFTVDRTRVLEICKGRWKGTWG